MKRAGPWDDEETYARARFLGGLHVPPEVPSWIFNRRKDLEEEQRPQRKPASVAHKNIGRFHIMMKSSKTGGCHIKVTDIWNNDRTVGVWNGDRELCQQKYRDIAEVLGKL